MITVSDLTKKFGLTLAVDKVSFEVKTGEIVGFLGPNGAGKSTTMRVITCFIAPTSGQAIVAGFDTITDSIQVKKRLGYLPESAPLYYDMTVREYLKFIADIRKIPGSEKIKRIKNMLETCGLESVYFKYIGELSKGFKQRVGLAQALIHDPDILILDEPTTGLDPSQIIEIRNLIKKIGQEKTVILSTHILQEVEAICNRVLIINKGAIIADDTPENLKTASDNKQLAVSLIIRNAEKENIIESINKIEDITDCTTGVSGDNEQTVKIKAHPDSNIQERLFKLAVDNNWILTELHTETISLEDIFIQLTADDDNAANEE